MSNHKCGKQHNLSRLKLIKASNDFALISTEAAWAGTRKKARLKKEQQGIKEGEFVTTEKLGQLLLFDESSCLLWSLQLAELGL